MILSIPVCFSVTVVADYVCTLLILCIWCGLDATEEQNLGSPSASRRVWGCCGDLLNPGRTLLARGSIQASVLVQNLGTLFGDGLHLFGLAWRTASWCRVVGHATMKAVSMLIHMERDTYIAEPGWTSWTTSPTHQQGRTGWGSITYTRKWGAYMRADR
jgi:hypothetical protein